MGNSSKNSHTAIVGVSGSGKTYKAFSLLKNSQVPVIYYNFKNQEVEVVKNYKTLNAKNTVRELDYCLNKYKFINYIPSSSADARLKEIEMLCKYAMKHKTFSNIILVFDESSSIVREGMREHPIIEVARMGRSMGVTLYVISQRLAGLSNEVLSQCDTLLIHRLKQQDYSYLKRLGYMSESIQDMLNKAPEYSHVELTGSTIKLHEC